MSLLYRFFGKIDRSMEIREPAPLPRGYPGKYPPPPHVPVETKIETMRALRAQIRSDGNSAKKRLGYFLGSKILQLAIQSIHWSCPLVRFTIHPQAKNLIEDPRGQFIIALWHNRLFYSVYGLKTRVARYGHDILAIISESNDAEFIARATEKWGAFCARGSSTRGGIKAVKKILKAVRYHFHPLITPDGPTGPVYQVKDGLPMLAKLTGLPIIPICYEAQKKWVLHSWDGFIIPKPFSKTILDYGEPILVEKDEDAALACVRSGALDNAGALKRDINTV